MKKRIIAMVLSVAMMLTMFPTGVLADDFVYEENTPSVTETAEGQSDENQGEGESASIVNEEPAPVESEDQTTDPVESASQETQPVESEDQTTDPVESASQETQPVESTSQTTDPAASSSQETAPAESASQATDPAASASQAAEPEEKDNSVNTADLYNPQPTQITGKNKIKVGETVELKSNAGYDYHDWTSDHEDVATVVGNGKTATVTGKKAGTVTIKHSYYGGYRTETFEITVLPAVSATSAKIKVDGKVHTEQDPPVTFSKYAAPPVLEAEIGPTGAEYESCTWSVDDTDVLKVDAETGKITAKGVGNAVVTLTVKNYDDSEFMAELPVTVTNPVPTSAEISVTAGNAEDLYPDDTLTLVPRVEPGSADEYNYAWESSDESTATVAPVAGDATQATVTAVGAGEAKITLTVTPKPAEAAASADEASPAADAAQPVKAELAVTVKAVTPAESVTIRSDKETVRVRETVQFTAAVNPTNAQGSYEWKTDNRQVLSIDKNGLATGEAAGTANVTVTFKGKDGNEITSDPIKITVTPAAQQYKREALVYYLKDPTKDANSNAGDQWGPSSLGTATVDVAGATWANDKNCFDVKGRVISWPTGYQGGVVPRNTPVWMTIFASYQESVQKELGRTITTDDVEEIWLEPAKISKNNSTTPDMHLDCNVKIKCHDIVMVNFKVQDVGDPTAIQVKAMNRFVNSTVSATDVPPYEKTKEDGKYAFRGWYLNSDFSGNKITFESDYQLGKDNVTFYGRYVEKHQVTYVLDGGSWADDNTLVYDVYEGDTHTVKADPTREGYRFDGWETTVTIQNGQFTMPDSDVTLTAKWIPTTRSYTVNYYWNGTTTPVHDSTTETANVGEKIENLEPVPVEGYTPVSNESKSITIQEDENQNVITFYYYKNVTLQANSDTLPYNGEEQRVSGFTGAPEDADFSAINVGTAGTDAGTYPAEFPEGTVGTVDANKKYIVTVANNGTLTISAKEVTVTADDKSKTYGDTTDPELTATVTGLVGEDTVDYTLSREPGENVGTYTITPSGEATQGNYTVTFETGTLTITPVTDKVTVTITGNTKTVTYDGEEHTVDGYSVSIDNALYTEADFTFSGTKVVKRTDANIGDERYMMGLKAEQFQNTSTNFTNVTFVVAKDGWLKINPYMISIEPTETTFKYNGEEPKVKTDKIEIRNENDGKGLLLNHHVESIETQGSGVDAGTYEWFSGHNAKILDGNNDVTANYQISYAAKTMTITPAPLKITTDSATKTYDGSALTAGGKIEGVVERDKKDVKLNITGSQTNAGTSDNTYTIEWGTAKATNYKIDEDIGKLTINPLEGVIVTITGNTDTVTYDGNLHTVEGYTVEFTENPDNLYKEADFKLNGEAKAAGTDAGTYNMGFVATSFENTNPNFKNVVFNITDGWLKITPKEIVPGENNKDLTATAPEDVVYNGESQQQKPIVKDGDKVLEEGKDYTLTYSEDTTNAGTVTVTITGKGNYGSKFEVTYKITRAPLKITTNSAEKTYDGSALTAGGKIEGLVKGETATLKTTGSQTEVGESKNTYEIEWDGTAKEANYKIAEEDIGTLKVNARSGGGSSSKPTPEEELTPTPTPTPTPLPTLPTTPAPTTPTRRVTRSTALATQPTSRPTEQITENETPKAESEPEVIEDEETPLAPMAGGAWALVNLILMLLTVLASLLLLLGYLGKKKYAKEDEYGNALHDANGNEIIDYTRNKKGFWRVASLIPAVAAVIAFVLTENMRLPMIMVDRWTLLMVIIAVVQLIVAVLCKKKKESEEDENQANA